MIIGSAVTLAVLKISKKLGLRKKNKNILKKDSFSQRNECSTCSAECMLRNAPPPVIQKNIDLCKEVEMKSDKL